jgi:release factor glutamine methyltransferase
MQLYLQFERPLDEPVLEKLRPLVRRRGAREPLQHLIGSVAFGGLDLSCDRRALVPRPETEHLVSVVCDRRAGSAPDRILDLGTGTGALALELARRFPSASVVAVERSRGALELARENAARNGLGDRVDFRQGDWYGALSESETFDWIVSNPPYLSEDEWRVCEPEVRVHDPKEALVADDEGLSDARVILAGAGLRLREGGLLALELGLGQPEKLAAEAQAQGWKADALPDLTGRLRYLLADRVS